VPDWLLTESIAGTDGSLKRRSHSCLTFRSCMLPAKLCSDDNVSNKRVLHAG